MVDITGGTSDEYTFISSGNPFAKSTDTEERVRNDYTPGTPWWWLQRLTQRLLDRMERYNTLENYALGYHPLPNLDYRYVRALKDLQRKARTNYCDLVIKATTERMKVKGFRFGPVGTADEDAKRIWEYSEMDYQSPLNLRIAGTFGFCYALVSPPDPNDPDSEPTITIEDPRTCIVERNPRNPINAIAGLKIWHDDVLQEVVAMLYLPDYVYTFATRKYADEQIDVDAFLTKRYQHFDAQNFELVLVQNNDLGSVPLIEGRWQPAFGDIGQSEHEIILDIQDRINHTVLDRLVISRNQAYRQRWATGVQVKKRKGKQAPPWDPGSDILWVTDNQDAKFGDFESADISQLLDAIRDDVGDMAAITQTPANYLSNRMINVSGDTLITAQSALVSKVRTRMEAMGHFYELIMRTAFKYKSDERGDEVHGEVLWADPEIRSMVEVADAASKWVAAGVPLQLIMERGGFSPDEIDWAVKERERVAAEEQMREDAVAQRDMEHQIQQMKAKSQQSSVTK